MGVLGLWKLLEPCGKPVPLESLEDKVLAVDVSIWLNQVLKGYRDGLNGTLPNAHLVGVFHRVCKLLMYGIKPVFVFDGGVPSLKQQTLSARRLKKAAASQAADHTSQKLVQNMLRQEAMRAVLGLVAPLPLAVGATGRPDPFVLPPVPPEEPEAGSGSESDSSDGESDIIVDRLQHDLHSFDFESEEFRSLAPQVKHDILSDLKDTRKQNSWGKLDQMPKDADVFSDFQMARLRKRKKFQDSMDDVEAEITRRNTELLHMGVDLPGTVTAHSMASKAGTFLLLSQPFTEERSIGDAVGGNCGATGGAATAAPAAVKIKAEPQKGEEDEAALVEAADMMEYLAGTDLFGGGGSSGGGSAARVDQRIDELKRTRPGPGGRGGAAGRGAGRSVADAEADTAQVFSEMGKKYSNLYLQFSAQWLEDEKKADVKAKWDSPHKRKAPEPAAKDAPPTKRSASKLSSDPPTLEELTRNLAKISDALRKKSRSGEFKKPSAPVSRPSSKPSRSVPARPTGTGLGAAAGAVASSSGILTVSIDPVRLPAADDLFGDVFSSSTAEDNVGLMSDSDEGGEDVLEEVSEDTSKGAPKNTSKPDSKHAPRDAGKFIPKDAAKDANKDSPKSASRHALKDAPKSAMGAVAEVKGGGPVSGMAGRGASETGSGIAHTGTKAGTGSSKGQLSDNGLRATALGDAGVGADRSGVKMEIGTSDPPDKNSERRRPIAELETSHGDDKVGLASDAKLSHDEAVAAEDKTVSSAGSSPARSEPHVSFHAASGAVSDEDPDGPEGAPPISGGRRMSLDMPVSPRRSDHAASETTASSAASANASTSAAKSEPALPDSVWNGMDDAELRDLAEELASEQMALLEERGRQQRDAAGVSDDMYRDVQALLEQFGIPYVVSPKEAEAQCAFLEIAGLTEGTITDDSDIWLFGGRRVYKNFFNQKKFVECYRAGDIEGSLGLTRGQLVCVALLTGSDYTLGVESVGCVRALEILAEFPGEGLSGLRAFRRWWDEYRAGAAAARTPIRRSLASLKLSQGFPAEAVMTAYLEPEVDTSREPFSWAAPDLDGLKHLAAAKFGWGGQHTDNALRPLLDRLKQKLAQRRLDAFFSAAHSQQAPAEGSRRLQEAVRRVRGDDPPPPTAEGASNSAITAMEEEESLEVLMDDGLDELLAAVEETGVDGDNDKRSGDVDDDLDGDLDKADGLDALEGADDFSAMEKQEALLAESSPLPDIAPGPGVAPRAAASRSGSRGRGGARGRGRGRGRVRKPTAIFTDDDPRPSAPATSRSAAPPRRQPDTAKRSASVPAEQADLDAVSCERVLLVRRLKDRANLVRSQIQHELPQSRPAVKRPSTRQVRARMMGTLLKQNPRLRLEREAQLRRRLGLPVNPVGRGRSCRDPGARRAESFSEALAEVDERRQPVETGTGDSVAPAPATVQAAAAAAALEPRRSVAPVPATTAATAAVESQTSSVTDSGPSPVAAATVSSVPPRPAAAAGGVGHRCPPPGPPSAARRQSAADRLRQAAAPAVLPAPAAAEEVPQRQVSQRRQAEARRHAAELLRAAGGTARDRRRAQRETGRRQRPALQPRAGPLRTGGLSESSDSD